MPLSRSQLGDLDKALAGGPRLGDGAVLGAGVAILLGWFTDSRAGIIKNGAMGAAAGAFVNFLRYGVKQWTSKEEHEFFEALPPELARLSGLPAPNSRVGIAPYPYYRPSVTYPWSEH